MILFSFSKMHPRLYLQPIQYAIFDSKHEKIYFENRLINGQRFTFILSKEQFYNFHDVIESIKQHYEYGHYPVGDGIWLHYNATIARLYRRIDDISIHYDFAYFEDYISFTHNRLFSLVNRLKHRRTTWSHNRAQHGTCPSTHKRPSSIALRVSNRLGKTKSTCGNRRKISSGTSNDAIMSHDDEESAILSEWHYSNPRRQCDSISSSSHSSKDLSSSVSICKEQFTCSSPIVFMEGE